MTREERRAGLGVSRDAWREAPERRRALGVARAAERAACARGPLAPVGTR